MFSWGEDSKNEKGGNKKCLAAFSGSFFPEMVCYPANEFDAVLRHLS
jgi:hypothetical protein